MATRKEQVEFILDQLEPLFVRAKSMFGEYALYCDDKTVAFICDDTLFLKPTEAVAAGEFEPGHPYPGSKEYWVLDADVLEDRERLQALIQATADTLPAPKPKKPRNAG